MNSYAIVAAAGSGKTTYLIEQALNSTGTVIILTYTIANEKSIRAKLISKTGYIPKNITVQTWYSFVIEHGIRPFSSLIIEERICGLQTETPKNKMINKKNIREYYFDNEMKVYSDRATDLALTIDQKGDQCVFSRIGKIFNTILIDEAQDLSGYDYNFVVELMRYCNIIIVGDPRQRTYTTNNNLKNKQYETIFDYLEKEEPSINIDKELLSVNHRCTQSITDYSNLLFLESGSISVDMNQFEDIHFIHRRDIDSYLNNNEKIIQLRYDSRTKCSDKKDIMNYGESKGLEFENVVIYPTKKITEWIYNHNTQLSSQTRCKLYVAITRARKTVNFVIDDDKSYDSIIKKYNLN